MQKKTQKKYPKIIKFSSKMLKKIYFTWVLLNKKSSRLQQPKMPKTTKNVKKKIRRFAPKNAKKAIYYFDIILLKNTVSNTPYFSKGKPSGRNLYRTGGVTQGIPLIVFWRSDGVQSSRTITKRGRWRESYFVLLCPITSEALN